MPTLMTPSFTCRLVLTRLLIRLMRALPWSTVYWTFVLTWMLTDKLKLYHDKSAFMLIGTKQQLSKVNIDSLTVGSIDVTPVTVARNLGTWFDSNLNLQNRSTKHANLGFPVYLIFGVSESICHRNLHALWSTLFLWVVLITTTAFFLVYPLFIYLNCNACRMQLLGLYVMFLGTAT